jgi:hypothetical protein
MNVKAILTGVLLLLAVAGVAYVLIGEDGGGEEPAVATATGALPADGVVVYYFHGNKRCMTCNKIESLADAVIAERFADERARGEVVFLPINLEVEANNHFVGDFELSNRTIVMVERRGGADVEWHRLDEVWTRIGDAADYQDYVAENLAACLAHLDG